MSAYQNLKAMIFTQKLNGQKLKKSLLTDENVVIVVQINGKKRGLISTKKEISEIDATKEAQKIDNVKKILEIKNN